MVVAQDNMRKFLIRLKEKEESKRRMEEQGSREDAQEEAKEEVGELHRQEYVKRGPADILK